MATHNKALQLIAFKLGLADDEKVLRKAAEFERLLQTKSTAGSNMTDTSKVVICLDLAASMFAAELDTKMAVKYSGLKVSLYNSCRKIIENLLELNSGTLTVRGLCVMLQCTSVQDLAENILAEYQKQAKVEIDLNLPQYVCMAVYQACRINKVKISKSKLVEKSRLKPAQFSKLEADWIKFVNENFANIKKKKGGQNESVKVLDEPDNAEAENSLKEKSCPEPAIEPYEDWKRRMLETAYKELEELQKQEKNKKQKIEGVNEERILSARKNNRSNQILSPRKSTRQLTPRKENNQLSSSRVTLQFSPRNNIQNLTSGKVCQNTLSPKEDPRLASITKVLLSPMKVDQISSPKNRASFLSPMQENLSPRRSPRKTPQKFSPYKTPSEKQGVRLLFPTNL